MKTIVVSAVNLRKGGTLTILRGCLQHLSGLVAAGEDYRVIALVHRRSLCDYPGIEYIEMPWCIRSWAHRLWAEYVTMNRISRRIAAEDGRKVWLWLSMHDTTPRVEAEHQEVYCHTSFPFLKLRARDWVMDPKIPLFSMLTRWAYRINIHRNDSIIVQQNWFADALSTLLNVPRATFRVIPPNSTSQQCFGKVDTQKSATFSYCEVGTAPKDGRDVGTQGISRERSDPAMPPPARGQGARSADSLTSDSDGAVPSEQCNRTVFFYASTPDCHKNFETLCEAARILEADPEAGEFKVILTIKGDENRYSRWLHKRWGELKSVDFHGFMSKQELFATYAACDCFVFPSRIETWGLPISEYISTKRSSDPGLILSDLPYAHETAAGKEADYFNPDDPAELASLMKKRLK